MKSFEINALGLEEMSSNEIQSINGGGAIDWLIEKAIDFLFEFVVDEIAESYRNGTQEDWYCFMYGGNQFYSPLH